MGEGHRGNSVLLGLAAACSLVALLGCSGKVKQSGTATDMTSGGAENGAGGDRGAGEAGNNGTAASSAAGGAEPETIETAGKIDLLFVIDNSISMSDKQAFFAQAVPSFVELLINPAEFRPVDDLHVGVITSSLGGHGADKCSPADPAATFNPHQADMSHLLPLVRDGLDSWDNSAFLSRDPNAADNPPGESDAQALKTAFATYIQAADEDGCGYEASLEAWYRFLVDPEPYQSLTLDGSNAVSTGVDSALLLQREAFLRPDSLLAIVMLTDENDCSIVDSGVGWLTAQSGGNFRMWSGTSTCQTDANSECCRSCGLSEKDGPPQGCTLVKDDPMCAGGGKLGLDTDAPNLRCFDQKRRFGWDLLYPTSRYVEALTEYEFSVPDPNGEGPTPANPTGDLMSVPNPLYQPVNGVRRDRSLVFLAGIVGVPWQDVATPDTLDDPTRLDYMTAAELEATGRWDVMIGPPDIRDPFMLEQPDPRTEGAQNPITLEPVVGPSSSDPEATINGHEFNNLTFDDLQYACTFRLPEPKDCVSAVSDGTGCDCFAAEDDPAGLGPSEYNRPLCNPPGGGAGVTLQSYAKGYPGLRQLEVLRGVGDNAIVASICPKITSGETSNPNYGYNPAVRAIIREFTRALEH